MWLAVLSTQHGAPGQTDLLRWLWCIMVCSHHPSGTLANVSTSPKTSCSTLLYVSQSDICFFLADVFLSGSLSQDDMHRVIDQQLMDKHQDEWRSAPSTLSGSSRACGGQTPTRARGISDRDKRLFSFFKKN